MTNDRLEVFEIDPRKDLIGTMTDGATVCESYGRKMGVIHQLCYDHAIHLAIMKVIYLLVIEARRQQRKALQSVDEDPDDTSDVERQCEDPPSDQNDADAENNDTDCDENESDISDDDEEVLELKLDIGRNVNAIREIVKLFKRSPKKNG